MKFMSNFLSKLSIFKELWDFMKVRKRWWLLPIVVMLVLLSILIVFTEGSALAPFIYTLF
jgi:preprotein translocase subunit SecF